MKIAQSGFHSEAARDEPTSVFVPVHAKPGHTAGGKPMQTDFFVDCSPEIAHEWGELPLLSANIELSTGRIARFEGLKFPKSLYDSLAGTDISVLINVCSARRATPDNLLDGGIRSEKMSAVKDSTIVLPVKLINETDSLPG